MKIRKTSMEMLDLGAHFGDRALSYGLKLKTPQLAGFGVRKMAPAYAQRTRGFGEVATVGKFSWEFSGNGADTFTPADTTTKAFLARLSAAINRAIDKAGLDPSMKVGSEEFDIDHQTALASLHAAFGRELANQILQVEPGDLIEGEGASLDALLSALEKYAPASDMKIPLMIGVGLVGLFLLMR